jgi:hypothetical protein
MTQKEIIKNYLFEALEKGDGWVLGGTIRSKFTNHGFIGFRGDRNARQLFRDKEIFARENDKGQVEYKYKHSFEEWQDKDFWKLPQISIFQTK